MPTKSPETNQPSAADADDFSAKYRKLAHRPKTWLIRLAMVSVPAAVTATGAYMKTRAEAANGYKALAEEVERQGKSIAEMQEDNKEWRKMLLQTLLTINGNGVRPPQPAMAAPPPPAPGYGSGGVRTPAAVPARAPVPAPTLPAPKKNMQEALKALADRPMPALQWRNLPKTLDAAQKKE